MIPHVEKTIALDITVKIPVHEPKPIFGVAKCGLPSLWAKYSKASDAQQPVYNRRCCI